MGYSEYRRVTPGSPIKASTINSIQDFVAEEAAEGLPRSAKKLDWRSGKIYVFVPRQDDDARTFTGFMLGGWCQTDTAKLINQTLTQGITLFVTSDTDSPIRVPAILLDTVRKRQYGNYAKALVPGGISPVFVKVGGGASRFTNHCTLDPEGRNFIYTHFGEYAIVAHADAIDERGDFCAVVPDVHGHLYGKVSGFDEYNGLYSVCIENNETQKIPCPLLRDRDFLPNNTRVICSRNIITGQWQIISASCPED